ncbi:MAG TPA: PAS domain S-box protein [Gammaproteobacteria bacterium]
MRHSVATELTRRDPLRVLLVDGDADDGALIDAATARFASITAVRTGERPPDDWAIGRHDLVVLGGDVRTSGLQRLLTQLKASDRHRPVILLTRDEAAARRALRYGLDDFSAPDDARGLAIAIGASLAHARRALAAELAERRRTESVIRRSEERARLLVTLWDAARGLDRPEEIAEASMRILREGLGADRCVYGDVDPDGQHFRFSAVATAPGISGVDGRFPLPPEASERLVKNLPIVIDDADHDVPAEALRNLLHAIGGKALIITPLLKGGRLYAAAGVHMIEPRRWTEDEIDLVDTVAERLWEAMELARLSRALRDSERHFRGLFELSAVGVAQSDPVTGRFLRANQRFCEITGYSQEEVCRLTFDDITHPDDRAANRAAIEKVLRGEAERWDIEKRYVRRDGSTVWVHVSGKVMLDESGRPYRLIANAADITDRKKAEEALTANRRRLQLVTDNAPVLIANCGKDYRYKFVNKAYAARYGMSPRDLVGVHVADVLGEDAFAQLKPHADRAFAGERDEFEVEVDFRGLGRQWIRCAYAPELDDHGNAVGWIAAVLDITDRKRAEEALRAADRRKDEFLAVLGHELRNPLAPLRAGIELLKEAERRPELLRSLREMMERQLAHLIHLVDDLLDLARVTRGDIDLERAPLDLRAVIRSAVELGMPLIDERRHRLEVSAGDVPLPVEGDFQRLTQVVGNLLSNAAKYTEAGGTIRITAGIEKDRAVVRVKDNGYGIPVDRLDDVFEMFSQVPEHRARTGGGGIGIGLALCRQLVTLHNGSIWAESAGLGQGSEFIVTLPLAARGPQAGETQKAAPARAARRVLVVDDNRDAAASLRLVLELDGHEVEAVHGAAEALRAVGEFRPEIVLLDIGLPEMDGYEVARRIRARRDGGAIRLFALTGWAQEEDKRKAFEAGFDEHLTKPVDSAVLRQLIARTGSADASGET